VDLELAHQPGDALLADLETLAEAKLGMKTRPTIGLVGVLPRLEDPLLEPLVGEAAWCARSRSISWNVMAADLSLSRNTPLPSAGSISPPPAGAPGGATPGSQRARRSRARHAPRSISSRRTQLRNVSGLSPSRRATTVIDSPLSRCNRTASSLNSGDHFDGRAILLTSLHTASAEYQDVNESGSTPTPIVLRPSRDDEHERPSPPIGFIRQWIESIVQTLKDQLRLERHLARTPEGLFARIVARVVALRAAIHLNWQSGEPTRALSAYAH
jgi:hypothetical protein